MTLPARAARARDFSRCDFVNVDRAPMAARVSGCLTVVLAAVFIGLPVSASAQNDVSPPVAREQPRPEAPTNQADLPLEGWVKVRYSVLADGTTADVRVMDVMPPQLGTKDIVAAVEKWTFEPATMSGEPVDWHNNESVIVFDDESVPLEPTPRFSQAYVEIIELLGQEDFDEAKERNERLLENGTTRLNEIGLLQAQAAIANVAAADLHAAYEAILRATDPDVVTLQAAELGDALRYRFGLSLELGHYLDALDTFERLNELETLPEGDVIAARAAAIREALSTDAAIIVKARVDREPWAYSPARRTFTIADVDGSVREIQVECNRGKAVLEFSADAEWSVPASWGNCMLFVAARRDTTFSLVEFP